MADPALPDDDADLPEPPRLRALRRMVTGLTAASIVGILAVAGALVIRATRDGPPPFDPAAVAAQAVTLAPGETVVAAGAAGRALILVTRGADGAEAMRFFDAETGAPERTVAIERSR